MTTLAQIAEPADIAAFDALISQATVPVVVVFRASWCGPCHQLAPRLDDAVRELGGRLQLVPADIERLPELAERYGVRSVPAMIVLRDGQEVARSNGLQTVARLLNFFEPIL